MLLDEFLSQFVQTTDYPTLDAMYYIMKKLNNPEKDLKFVHIAGTNGKGSICEMLSQILTNSNYKVGKFISPHLIESNESISINNINITDLEFQKYINLFQEISNDYYNETGRKTTRFEILTSIAILYFYHNNCDIVVLEVGLGGLYDCTNVVNPIISAFGTISYDHTAILGNTLKEIAIQKGGIIKQNSNTVIFNQPALKYIYQICTEKNSELYIINNKEKYFSPTQTSNNDLNNQKMGNYSFIENYSFDNNFQYFDYENYKNIKINLKGKKQIENTAIVIKCIEILKKYNFTVNKGTIYKTLQNIHHPARFEIICKKPLTIFDGAHNENALENFCETVNNLYSNKNKTFIISVLKTKDYKKNISILLNSFKNSKFIFCSGTNEVNNDNKFFDCSVLYQYAQSELMNKTKLNQLNTTNSTSKKSIEQKIQKMSLTDALEYLKKEDNQNYNTFFIVR